MTEMRCAAVVATVVSPRVCCLLCAVFAVCLRLAGAQARFQYPQLKEFGSVVPFEPYSCALYVGWAAHSPF